jgi:alanine dehydrogenase
MSEVAGRLSIQAGAACLERHAGGRGILLGGVPGIGRGNVLILGAGIVGKNACQMAIGLGARVTVLDISPKPLTYLDDIYQNTITTKYATAPNIEACLTEADLVIGGVLIPGAAAPKLVRKEHLKLMKKGSVIVDVSVDQGGCCESSHPTSHSKPTYIVDDVVHYCVNNMPGVVPLSSTKALSCATIRYGLEIAKKGWERAVNESNPIKCGLNTYKGLLANKPVAEAHGMEDKYKPL